VRLAQYAVLGVGGVRALRAMGIEPSVFHLNEGHAALAAVELAGERLAAGAPPDALWPPSATGSSLPPTRPWPRATRRTIRERCLACSDRCSIVLVVGPA
jgi:hypothetical protein